MNRLLSVIILFFVLIACKQKAQEGKSTEAAVLPPQYYYFPKANVYVDSSNKDYLFLAGDGKNWQTAKQIPAAMQALMDKSVRIEHPSQPVWQDNDNHRLVYSALLYATPNDTTKKQPSKPVAAPSNPAKDTVKENEKERKGLRKFFDKLFGKNKKDKRRDSVSGEQ